MSRELAMEEVRIAYIFASKKTEILTDKAG